MLLSLLPCLLIFPGLILGLAWAPVSRLNLDPAEKIVATCTLSLLGIFLLAWAVYVCALPVNWLWGLPLLAAAGLASGRHALAAVLRDADVRALLAAQGVVSASCLGWLALVPSYSGGGWVGDWFNHYDRTLFFLEQWPRDFLFFGYDAMPSRPPATNVITGAILVMAGKGFPQYQLCFTLLSSLAFLPAAILARRFGGRRAIPVLVLLFMFNPLFVQNATYTWTKLPAAFFILTALYFFLRAHDPAAPPAAAGLFAASLAAGLLTHYSAGPYALLFAAAWVGMNRGRLRDLSWWRVTARAALAGGLVLATWFGWALMIYGWRGTFLSNSSVTTQAANVMAQWQVVMLNLRDTFVPHFLRTPDYGMFVQSSSAGWWRDWFFQLYQVNFPLVLGSVAWAAILAALARGWKDTPARWRAFWTAFIIGSALLGVVVHGARDTWGLAHICLQPLVLLGLAFLAAQWHSLGPAWRRMLVIGATVDFSLGIALQFGVQNGALDRWLGPGHLGPITFFPYSQFALMNLHAKLQYSRVFVGDLLAPQAGLVCAGLGLLLLLALVRVSRPLPPGAAGNRPGAIVSGPPAAG